MAHLQKVFPQLAAVAFFLLGPALYGQVSTYPVQVLTLGVLDQRGQFVTDIQREQIVIKGVAATAERVELDNAPRRILLLLDASGSMGKYQSLSWSNVAQFAIRFALQRKGGDSIGLDTFADEDEVRVPFTTDSEFVVKQVEAFTGSGKGRSMLGIGLNEILARREMDSDLAMRLSSFPTGTAVTLTKQILLASVMT